MYASFFGLSQAPFSIAPDPRFLFMSERHREALAHLLYGVQGGGGFVLLTGEIGAGKTTVGRCFLEQLPSNCAVAYIFNPRLSVGELLETICSEFGIPVVGAGTSVKARVDALNRFLLQGHAQGRQALLVIDEAQNLSADVLEQLRLLTNLETTERKLLQIVLIGQPELRLMLAQPGLEQLAQRVIARYHLGPLSQAETSQYISHRLSVAGPGAPGAATPEPFDEAALAAIHRLSGGVPRRINLLADRALLGAYAQGRHRVDKRTVAQAAREVFDTGSGRAAGAGRPTWPLMVGVLAVALAAVVVLLAAGVGLRHRGIGIGQKGVSAASAAAAPASAAPELLAASAAGAASAASGVPAVVSAAAAASRPAPPDPPLPPPLNDAALVIEGAQGSEATAWRELALRWNVAIGEGDPCQVASQARLACFHSVQGGLPLLRLLGRPAMLVLRGPRGERLQVLLVELTGQRATLQAGSQRWDLTLPALASVWRGEFATLWRTPQGWHEGADPLESPAARSWIAQQLPPPTLGAPATLRERVAAFQVVQGLPPDGRTGPLTLMQLNRQAGIDEPRLDASAR